MVYPFLPVFGRSLGVDLAALSLALSVRSLTGAIGPVLATVADSRGRKAGMVFGLSLFTGGLLLVVLWPIYPVFLLALIMTTMGKHVFDPSMQAYVGDKVAYERRGRALAVTELSWSLAFILGIPLVGFIISRRGWLAPFPLLALLGLLSIGLILHLIPRDAPLSSERRRFLANFRNVLTYTPALAGLSIGILLNASNEVINLVFGVWMEDAFGLHIAAIGAASAVIGLSELGGESLVGGLTDRLGKPRAIGLGIALNSLAAMALPLIGRDVTGALAGLFLFYITFEFTLVSSIPLMTELLPSARATLMALNVAGLSLGRALGASLASPLYLFAPGLIGSAGAAVFFNLCGLIALSWLVRAANEKGLKVA